MKNIFIAVIFLFCSFTSFACEICGCGTGNYYMGLLPQFRSSFLGARYQFSSFHTSMKNDPGQYSNDHFQTVEIWGGINIGKRWQVLAMLPFNMIHQVSDDGSFNSKGIGDITATVNYKLINSSATTSGNKLITQQVWVGAGIKLATGKFDIDMNDPALIALANTQVGSGSTDFILNAFYNININNFGISSGARYKINTANQDQYSFGNRIAASSIAYYAFKKSNHTITPNIGLMFDHADASKSSKLKIPETAGYLLSAASGVEMNFKSIAIGCNVQLPLAQNYANEQTTTKVKGMFYVTFSL